MKNKKKKFFFVTGARSEYGQFSQLLKELNSINKYKFGLIVTGSHLKKEFGNTYHEIEKEKNKIYKKINIFFKNKKENVTPKIFSNIINKFTLFFNKEKPDYVILPGDRYEIFAIALACYFLNIPIIHFYGGDTSLGSKDEYYRNSISLISKYHFVSNIKHKQKLINKLGIEDDKIFNVGAVSLDKIKTIKFYRKNEIEKFLNINLDKKTILFTYHSVTTDQKITKKEIDISLKALSFFKNINIIFTRPNVDQGSDFISKKIKKFCIKNKKNYKFFDSLGYKLYFSLIRHSKLVVGNSSSLLYEVPYFKKHSINIGKRQKGRLTGNSVINIDSNLTNLKKTLEKYLNVKDPKKVTNPYFKKSSTKQIINTLKKII